MRLEDVVQTSQAVAATAARLEKIERLADVLRRTPEVEVEIAVAFLSGGVRQGRIGLGGATLFRAGRQARPASASSLDLAEVDAAFQHMATLSGPGSTRERAASFEALLARATGAEQEFLCRLVAGELRQGALEGVLAEAVARAANVPADRVRRAVMMTGDLGPVARAALTAGADGLLAFDVRLFRPLQPMLADTAGSVEEALAELGEAAFEWKLDGARVQVHRSGGDVRVFSRQLREVTPAVPEIVEAASDLPVREAILDGEVLALRPDLAPQPFQVTMRRFGRRLDVEAQRKELPLTPYFFDCLFLDGASLLDTPQRERFAALRGILPAPLLVPSLLTARAAEAQAFYDEALRHGHEGLVAKAPGAPYAAGRRGKAWLKLKPARSLDLVVLAAEWGSGRRRGWLSNLHLGARETEGGGVVMLGKTFKGLTDETLAWQTARLLERETRREGHVVHVRPELVVEIEYGDLQASPRYPGGLALRFARVKRYRPDKGAEDADTFAAVQEAYRRATGEPPPRRRG
jgi:DNA ligase-1